MSEKTTWKDEGKKVKLYVVADKEVDKHVGDGKKPFGL